MLPARKDVADMPLAIELIRRGYFPRELPPPFSTDSLAGYADSILANLLAVLPGNEPARLLTHALGRPGRLTRLLGIPNPIWHLRLCLAVEQNWAALLAASNNSPLSLSKPAESLPPGRAIVRSPGISSRPISRAESRAGGQFTLVADISRFYPSVYTHSLPWALHTKATAKAQRNNQQLLGNHLDWLIRQAQDGQSVGLPIGPDTSHVMAETVLSALDVALGAGLPGLRGSRYVDDYDLTFQGRAEAETGLHLLQRLLQGYGLALNPSKTKILELPEPLDDLWVSELRTWPLRSHPLAQRNDLASFFGRAFVLSKVKPDAPVLQYAVARMSSVEVEPANWPIYQALLLQCVPSQVGTLPFIFAQLAKYQQRGISPGKQLLERALNEHIVRHCLLGYASEVAWAIWGLMAYGCSIHEEAGTALSDIDDSIVALLALDARQRGTFLHAPNVGRWAASMTPEDLLGDQWLLAYEANIKNWLPSVGGGDHVAAVPGFHALKQAAVSFYDGTLVAPIVPAAAIPQGGPVMYAAPP